MLQGKVYVGDLASRQLHNKLSVFLVEPLLSQRKLIITAVLAFCSKHKVLICKMKIWILGKHFYAT